MLQSKFFTIVAVLVFLCLTGIVVMQVLEGMTLGLIQ